MALIIEMDGHLLCTECENKCQQGNDKSRKC